MSDSPIGKYQIRLFVAAYGGGNNVAGGPYDAAGNLIAGAVEYEMLPMGGDLKVSQTPGAATIEMHNGRSTGLSAYGDQQARTIGCTVGVRALPRTPAGPGDASLVDFLTGGHPTAISTESAQLAVADPVGVPFRYWTKQETWTADRSGRISFVIFGHCRTVSFDVSQGDTLTASWSAEVWTPPLILATTRLPEGVIYAG